MQIIEKSITQKLSQNENNSLQTILGTMGLSTAWIGITDSASEGTWVDFDGNAFGSGARSAFTTVNGRYENFNGNEPNNEGNEDYATIFASSGNWNDHYASNPVLCQKPADKGKIIHVNVTLFNSLIRCSSRSKLDF